MGTAPGHCIIRAGSVKPHRGLTSCLPGHQPVLACLCGHLRGVVLPAKPIWATTASARVPWPPPVEAAPPEPVDRAATVVA